MADKGEISEFARELLRTDSLKVDGVLQEVREVLRRLGTEMGGGLCWCPGPDWPRSHSDTCQVAQCLWYRLERK